MNNHYEDYELVAPSASAMMESLRAYGYSPATAIADIIDNSISAGAREVWLNFYWSGQNSYITILDNGSGMDETTLVAAMRPGSCNPLEERSPRDLGRFGMGLKTASFSQCRRLTVKSRVPDSAAKARTWDIDHIIRTDQWQLLKSIPTETESRLSCLDNVKHGTVVLWEKLDKLMGQHNSVDSDEDQQRFYAIFDEVKAYLGMVFHVYMSGINPRIRIYANDNLLKPWDPFCENHPATIQSPAEIIRHTNGDTSIKGFTLPHKDRLSPGDYEMNAGPGGWLARQGIYVYRNDRLLVAGGWLGLGGRRPWAQEEQYKLARIRVDITSTQDFDWLIDVKKSTAKPPAWIRGRLTTLANDIREKSRGIFMHRGAYGPRAATERINRIWRQNNENGRWSYKIDRNHHLIGEIRKTILLTQTHRDLFNFLLRTLEETVPIPAIYLAAAENPESYETPFESSDDMEMRRLIEISYEAFIAQGLTESAAKNRLRELEEFQDSKHLCHIEQLDGGVENEQK